MCIQVCKLMFWGIIICDLVYVVVDSHHADVYIVVVFELYILFQL